MTPSLSIKSWKLFVLIFVLLAVVFLAYVAWQFDQTARQSERHTYSYMIELSYSAPIDNVTLILPVPELNTTPFFTESLLNGAAYGVPPGWDLTIENVNGSPMLAVRAGQMVPDYHGSPIAIGPGSGPLPTTLVPGHEYTSDTPVLMPVTIAVMEPGTAVIDTHAPVGREPVFFPGGTFTPGSSITPLAGGSVYNHHVPVYINYTSEHPADLWIRISVTGTSAIWKGGWESNSYSDTVFVERNDGMKGWFDGEGKLVTAQGVYY